MKIFYNKYFPPKDFWAINLFGIIVARKDYGQLGDIDENHERIHTRQMFEMLFILFYLFYMIEWFVRYIQYKDRLIAYENISFEREAYTNMYDTSYLKRRSIFSFIHYYKKKG